MNYIKNNPKTFVSGLVAAIGGYLATTPDAGLQTLGKVLSFVGMAGVAYFTADAKPKP